MSIWNFGKEKEESVKSYWLDDELIEEFIETRDLTHQQTKDSYRKAIKLFGEFLEARHSVTATESDILAYLKGEIVRRGRGGTYAHNAILKGFSRFIYNRHLIPEDPFATADYESIGLTWKDVERERRKKQHKEYEERYSLEEIADLLLVLSGHPKEEVLEIIK